jgi:ectoine hydroxylase-related dioxygenase (phytanoyl-CoA dioxygenase family)
MPIFGIDKLKLSYYKIKFEFLRNTRFTKLNYKNYVKFKKIESKNIIKDLKDNGYVVIKNYLNADECNSIKENIENCIKFKKDKIWIDEEKSDFRIFGFNHYCNLTKKFFFSEEILKIISEYMDCKMENIFTMANRLSYVSNNKGSGGGWHRDSINPSMKALLYLVDVDIENGPLQLIKNSNQFSNILSDSRNMNIKNFLDTRYTNDQVKKIENIDEKMVNLTYKKGTLIIFDGSNIHRGKPISKNTRYAVTNYYFPIGKMSQKKYQVRPQIFDEKI